MDYILYGKLVFAFTNMVIYKYTFEECIKVGRYLLLLEHIVVGIVIIPALYIVFSFQRFTK